MHVPAAFYNLAPSELLNTRSDRYEGGEFGVDLGTLAPLDRERLARIYAAVNDVSHGPPEAADALRDRLMAVETEALIRDASALGRATATAVTDAPRVLQLLHDVRGGGLQVFIGTIELLRLEPGPIGFARNAVSAARDHAKIMRAGFPALDPETYARDESARIHAIDGFVVTWDGLTVKHEGRPVTVSVHCEYRGAITGRCLETASIDRIMYNYMNNAVRFAADGTVAVWIFRVAPGLVRWVVHNAISDDTRRWLVGTTGGDLRQLFNGGATRGGNGVGLRGCAEIVATCFGLKPQQALDAGHLGARLSETGYSAWFHWPTYAAEEISKLAAV